MTGRIESSQLCTVVPIDPAMLEVGDIVLFKEPALERTFYSTLAPISQKWVPEALQVSGFSHEDTRKFANPAEIAPTRSRLFLLQSLTHELICK